MFSEENIKVATPKSCEKIHSHTPFILVLHQGEELIDGIINCAKRANISGASFFGIGALKNPILAYYFLADKRYRDKRFTGIYELTSLNGNISKLDNKLNIHAHAVIGNAKYNSYSGHLKRATVGATVEITIIPLEASIVRKFDPITGLNLLLI